MAWSTINTSSLIGGQTAMFSNQASYSQQIAGMYGTGPRMGGAGMQNPFPQPMAPSFGGAGMLNPDLGTQMAGGMAGALPAMMGGASLAAGFMGGAAGWADPFTGTARGFWAGSGGMGGMGSAWKAGYGGVAEGAGIASKLGGGFGSVGRQAAALGVRGVGGALAGGALAATGVGLAYYAAGSIMTSAVEQFGAGARTISDVGMMANAYMGPQTGQPGSRPGGGMGRTQIRQMASVLENLASDDTMATVDSLKRLMDKVGQAGMLQGIGDAQQFKQRFGDIVKQVKNVAMVMGTTLEDAAPLMGQMRQMGMWRTGDIMGTATALKAAGPMAAGQMMGAMQQGAQVSHAMGGRMGAGAAMSRDLFMQIQAAQRTGTISPEMMMEFTGGAEGPEGQQIMAQKLGGVMSGFAESPMGRLMMAGMGEFKGGAYTGGIDKKKLQQFMSGQLDVGQLQQTGQRQSGQSQEAATSFMVRGGAIGQEMMAAGGMEAMGMAVKQVMERAGKADAGENIKNMFIQKMMNVDARTAEMIRRIADDIPRIQEEKQRKMEATLDEQFREVDIRMNRSWGGFKDTWAQAQEEFWKPVRELGADVATSFGRAVDQASDSIWGRTKSFQMSAGERQRMMWREGLAGGAPVDLGMSQPSETTMISQMRNIGGGGVGLGGIGGIAAYGMGLSSGTNLDMMRRLGAQTRDAVPGSQDQGWATMEGGGGGAGRYMARGLTMGALQTALGAGGGLGGFGGGNLAAAGRGIEGAILGGRKQVYLGDQDEMFRHALGRAEDRTWKGLGFAGDQTKYQGSVDEAAAGMRTLLSDPAILKEYEEMRGKNPTGKEQTEWLMSKLQGKDRKAWEAMRRVAGGVGTGNRATNYMDAMALVMDKAKVGEAFAPDWKADVEKMKDVQIASTPDQADRMIQENLTNEARTLQSEGTSWLGKAAEALLPGGATSRGAEQLEIQSTLEDILQSGEAKEISEVLSGKGTRTVGDLSEAGQRKYAALAKLVGGNTEAQQRLAATLGKSADLRVTRAQMVERGKVSTAARGQLTTLRGGGLGVTGAVKEKLQGLLETYSSAAYERGEGGAMSSATEQMRALVEGDDATLKALREGGGEFGARITELAGTVKAAGKLTTGKGVKYEDIAGKLPSEAAGLREEIEKMVSTGGEFTESERKELQELILQRGASSAGGGTAAARGGATERLTELMTKYTEANTKFVFAVGASVAGLNKEDVDKMVAAGQAEVSGTNVTVPVTEKKP